MRGKLSYATQEESDMTTIYYIKLQHPFVCLSVCMSVYLFVWREGGRAGTLAKPGNRLVIYNAMGWSKC